MDFLSNIQIPVNNAPLPSDLDKISDEALRHTYTQCVENSSCFPAVKAELKAKILSKRHGSGLPEIKVEFTPPIQYELTPDEKRRQEQRRLHNKRSAKHSRDKKKQEQENVLDILKQLQRENSRLLQKVKELEFLKTEWIEKLNVLEENQNIVEITNAQELSSIDLNVLLRHCDHLEFV